jgi:hypothetical protein
MKFPTLTTLGTAAVLAIIAPGGAQQHQKHSMDMPAKHPEKMSPQSALQPAEGASVEIIKPEEGQVFKGDSVPLEFTMEKGKRGEHVHVYVDGQMMGMFKAKKGTLTGIKPGHHTLELRVATKDHNIELNATDRVSFITK